MQLQALLSGVRVTTASASPAAAARSHTAARPSSHRDQTQPSAQSEQSDSQSGLHFSFDDDAVNETSSHMSRLSSGCVVVPRNETAGAADTHMCILIRPTDQHDAQSPG